MNYEIKKMARIFARGIQMVCHFDTYQTNNRQGMEQKNNIKYSCKGIG